MALDSDSCWEALKARDSRFDGTFFVCVTTTGIYCRPICPARQPARKRCEFYETSAEAERAGFRACLRCRPELAPGNAIVDSTSRIVRAAVRQIGSGYLDDHSVNELASQLGVTDRHLRRSMESEIGVSPVELGQTRRLALAKQLLHDTNLAVTEVAFAAGFGSVRRFNALFLSRFGRKPSELRRQRTRVKGTVISLRLDYRPPLDWDSLLAFLGPRAIPGVEHVTENAYSRTAAIDGCVGCVRVRRDSKRSALVAEISTSLVPVIGRIVPKLRSLFDLDSRPTVIADHLAKDPIVRRSLRTREGLRLPGSFSGFEIAVRAILGQQVSVKGATTISGRFAARYGRKLSDKDSHCFEPRVLFPTATDVASKRAAHIQKVGIPYARATTIRLLAQSVVRREVDLSAGAEPEAVIATLEEIAGIGPWTSHYIAMRALHWPNAFPAGDLILRRVLGVTSAKAANARAKAWDPWRAYGALHCWALSKETR